MLRTLGCTARQGHYTLNGPRRAMLARPTCGPASTPNRVGSANHLRPPERRYQLGAVNHLRPPARRYQLGAANHLRPPARPTRTWWGPNAARTAAPARPQAR